MRGYAYYSGVRFAVYVPVHSDAVARRALRRGGRGVRPQPPGGRLQPDLKTLVGCVVPGPVLRGAIRAPWARTPGLRAPVRRLREQGETVVCILPGHEHEAEEFECDRELARSAPGWMVARAA